MQGIKIGQNLKIQNNSIRRGEFKLPIQKGNFYYPKRDFLLNSDCSAYVSQSPSLTNSVKEELPNDEQLTLIRNSLSLLNRIVTEARSNGVKIVLFITPHHRAFLDKINLNLYLQFLNGLSEISSFWNFGFYSQFTMNNCNYYESSHYAPFAAPIIYQVINNFQYPLIGHHVNSFNINKELEFIKLNFLKNREK